MSTAPADTTLASLRSTQAGTGGESQTPAPAGDAVEALRLLDECPAERLAFNKLAARNGGPLQVIAAALTMAHNMDTGGGTWGKSLAIYANECALAAIAQGPGAGQAWRPIETAPKDGTHLWLYWPKAAEDDRQAVGWWHDSLHGSWWMDHADSEKADPTHWMPLPTDPALVIEGEV